MAHPKAVPLELGGTTRHLVYDMNALCALRDVGVDAFTLTEGQLTDPRVVRSLIWAGLKLESPDLTPEQVGSWIDLSNLVDVGQAFTQAFERSTQRESPQ